MDKKKGIIIGAVVIAVVVILAIMLGKQGYLTKTDGKQAVEVKYMFDGNSTAVTVGDDAFSNQGDVDAKLLAASKDDKYTISNPFVLKNPYGVSPLTAVIVFKTRSKESVSLEVNGKKYDFESSENHIIPVYGLIAGNDNTVKISAKSGSKTLNIDTKDVKNDLTVKVEKEASVASNDIYVVGDGIGYYGFNNSGSLIWKLENNYKGTLYQLDNGHFLLFDNSYMSQFYNKGVLEIDFLGRIYNNYDYENGAFGGLISLPNGNILTVTNTNKYNTYDDQIVEVDSKTGKIVKEFDLYKLISDISPNFISSLDVDFEASTNWASTVSLYYDSKNDVIYASLLRRDSIIAIDYNTGKLNWIFGELKNWNNDFKSYLVEMPSGVHAYAANSISMDRDGNFLLFDNAFDNTVMNDLCAKYINARSSAKVFKIENKKAELLLNFTDDNSMFSYAVSGMSQAANGNYIVTSSWEFNPESFKEPHCTLNGNLDGLSTKIYEIDKTGNILFKFSIPRGTYNVSKIDFYSSGNKNIQLNELKTFTTLDAKTYESFNVNEILSDLKSAEDMNLAINMTKNLMQVASVFMPDEEAYVILVGEDGIAHKYLIKSKTGYAQTNVNLQGISGKFSAYYLLDNVYYNLNKIFVIDN